MPVTNGLTTTGKNNAVAGVTASVTHIGLVDASGTELTGGTYARVAVSWAAASGGVQKPSADLTFNVPAGATVGGWMGFTASSAGTQIGGAPLTNEAYTGAGQYVLDAASTSYTVA